MASETEGIRRPLFPEPEAGLLLFEGGGLKGVEWMMGLGIRMRWAGTAQENSLMVPRQVCCQVRKLGRVEGRARCSACCQQGGAAGMRRE